MTVGFQIKDLLTVFIDICFSLVRTFLKLIDLFVNKFCIFFHIRTIFFKRLLLFFNGRDVSLCIGYFILKTIVFSFLIFEFLICLPTEYHKIFLRTSGNLSVRSKIELKFGSVGF